MMRVLNIEEGMPSLDEARREVAAVLRRARRDGVRVLKIIHGYGSSGTGGKLCSGLRKSFRLRQQEQLIRAFVEGERFHIFTPVVHEMFDAEPELRGDPDLGRTNEGVTFIWVQ